MKAGASRTDISAPELLGNGTLFVGGRLQRCYNPKTHYLPIQREYLFHKYCAARKL